jgi:hypothetical protein
MKQEIPNNEWRVQKHLGQKERWWGREKERERKELWPIFWYFSVLWPLYSVQPDVRTPDLQHITVMGPSMARTSLTTFIKCYCLLNTFQITLIYNMSLHYLITLLKIFSKNPSDTMGFSNPYTVNVWKCEAKTSSALRPGLCTIILSKSCAIFHFCKMVLTEILNMIFLI